MMLSWLSTTRSTHEPLTPTAATGPLLATAQLTRACAPDSTLAGTARLVTARSAYWRTLALKAPLASLFDSALPAGLVSNRIPPPTAELSALTSTSNCPAPRAPSGSTKFSERVRASPGTSGLAASPAKATAVLRMMAPGEPSALRRRITTRSW